MTGTSARGQSWMLDRRSDRRRLRGRDAEFLIFVLELVELPVEAALCEEFLVAAHLAELALVHDENGVCALHGGEPVCDEDAGAAFDHAL